MHPIDMVYLVPLSVPGIYIYIYICIPDMHPHRVTNTKCRIDTVISPDNGYIVARNM